MKTENFLSKGVMFCNPSYGCPRLYEYRNQLQLMQLKTELDFIDDEGMFSWSEHSFMKYHTVWKILCWLASLLAEQISADMPLAEKKYERQIIRVLEYIHKNYSEKITIESLCRMAFLSR